MAGILILTAIISVITSPVSAQPKQAGWHRVSSPHFEISYEPDWKLSGIAVEFERIHSRMRMDMAMFAPWMFTGKVKIYVYSRADSYFAGEFHPPLWSKGIAFFKERVIALYNPGQKEKLADLVTHELSHLFFESFYGENAKNLPVWLNEGVAVLMEDSNSASSGNGSWNYALEYVPYERMFTFESFFPLEPKNVPSDKVADWYLQAYGIVKFLYRGHSKVQFHNFCRLLRDGKSLNKALWEVYRFYDVGVFEAKWLDWLRGSRRNSKIRGPMREPFRNLRGSTLTFRSWFENH